MSGINKAAKIGIIIKSGAAIEQIGKSLAVVFDKTGTITYGSLVVEDIIILTKDSERKRQEENDNINDSIIVSNNINNNVLTSNNNNNASNDLLLKAASIEQMSSHPAASVIVQKAIEKLGSSLLPIPRNFHEVAGAGVEGDIDSEHIMVGSQSLFENNEDNKKYHNHQQHQLQQQEQLEQFDKKLLLNIIKNRAEGKMVAFIGINSTLVGAIILGDKIRSGVNAMMKRLQNLGVKETVMLTGDSFESVQVIAKQAAVINFESNLLPEQKVVAIKRLKERYKNIVMVGDGINDAPALAAATVGIAMGAKGTAITAEAAD
jgi:Zn2+/Cd2+-exporting ATPase